MPGSLIGQTKKHSLSAETQSKLETNNQNKFAVVGIGASAGGLEACRKFLSAVPRECGMAFILVQHLDPNHASMMVDLLSGHTSLSVVQAVDGMRIEREHLYIIPPGAYLSVRDGALHLSNPQTRHGARLPFDFLLHSLANTYETRAICVILSGTGADGSIGLKTVKEKSGLVVVQDPQEAGYDGMPQSAIVTGLVDLVLSAGKIPEALIEHEKQLSNLPFPERAPKPKSVEDWLPEFIELLRTKTAHDFTLYKTGTLQRRIERRLALRSIGTDHADKYLDILKRDPDELELLAKDLLINVTSFFRDQSVFDLVAKTIIPDLVRNQASDQPLRIWIAGCSTGEEAYSFAMLFREAITAERHNIKLQVFASDVDPDAIAVAREGLYPETIKTDVSASRLRRFFSKEEHGYRVSPELRAAVVFTVQDVLIDPPFSRLDLVSCRNLLIYLGTDAQEKVISLFHFALREGGVLLLGSAETAGDRDDRFETIAKAERLYRHVGRRQPGELSFTMKGGEAARVLSRPGQIPAPAPQNALADICRQLILEAYAPAAVLINRKHECLYALGPTDRYLRMAPGYPTHDLLAMMPPTLRAKLRSAIQRTSVEIANSVVTGGHAHFNGGEVFYTIEVKLVPNDGEELLLICFVDKADNEAKQDRTATPQEVSRVTELEQELEATKTELSGAIRNLEISTEEQNAVNEEALSVNEEYQSTNEELLTSKEELQSLNEELTALNSQLQETMDLHRTTSNDLQNVLYSTDVATIFLDKTLNIRFFTPATKSLFSVIASDVGRPLGDLNSLTADSALLADARLVLQSETPLEREIEAQTGSWYIRRILPYRTLDNRVEGVVITFADMTERKHVSDILDAAKRQAEQATIAKSRFLAAASHDLRQPLQTLSLLQGLLEKNVTGEKAQKLVTRFDETLSAMSGMLNTLLDINQIEAGTVQPEIVNFPINDVLDGLLSEFTYNAQAKGLSLRVVPSSQSIKSDPRLLAQMIRNLLSNALKYTKRGKVLVGCRPHGDKLSVEIWDTGIGIPGGELQAIFEEYHQLDNTARERSRGLGLGLSIVQRLANLLGHRVSVRSTPDKGSVFAIEVTMPTDGSAQQRERRPRELQKEAVEEIPHNGVILVIEDDPEVRELLDLLLTDEGYRAVTAPDGPSALALIERGTIWPDLILADYNLPNGMNGLQVTTKLREQLQAKIPVIILTGDISTETLRNIALHNYVQLNKPVKLKEMIEVIQRLLQTSKLPAPSAVIAPPRVKTDGSKGQAVIYVVDDDAHIRNAIRATLEDDGRNVEDFASCEEFLDAFHAGREACLLIDAYLPGMDGLELLQKLKDAGHHLPAIMITGNSDVAIAVQAMKAGASDFIEKPISRDELLVCVERAFEQSRDSNILMAWKEDAANHVAGLTSRQHQIMAMVLAGHPSKNIAADLGISQRTVENHRASIMKKTGSKSLPALARLALAAGE